MSASESDLVLVQHKIDLEPCAVVWRYFSRSQHRRTCGAVRVFVAANADVRL